MMILKAIGWAALAILTLGTAVALLVAFMRLIGCGSRT